QLQGDYFIYDDARHRLVGERTRQQYRLSDPVRVKVIDSNPETKHIDFELISPVIEGGNDKKSAGERAVPKKSRNKHQGDSSKKDRSKKSGRVKRDDASSNKSQKKR